MADRTRDERCQGRGLRRWAVAGAVLEGPDGLLLVENRRADGRVDWTPPGGVIDEHRGEEVLEGLTREVKEETGLTVHSWGRVLYRVEAVAPDLGWHMSASVWLATEWSGELRVGDDPDGIVTRAQWLQADEHERRLRSAQRWVAEPLLAWCDQRWECEPDPFRYMVDGRSRSDFAIRRIPT